jgi:hypothetical protein
MGRRSAGRRIERLARQLDRLEKEHGTEAGCEICSGGNYQRIITEGEDPRCPACGSTAGVLTIGERIVSTPEEVAAALAEAAAAGVEVLGPLAHHASEDAPEAYQTIERIEDVPDAGGK